MQKPKPIAGLRHLALNVQKLEECVKFYIDLFDMKIDWQPDADNYYLSTGSDMLALHRAPANFDTKSPQHLDHFGFVLAEKEQVDVWYQFLLAHQVAMKTKPRLHRDNSYGFYCFDPDGNTIELIYHPSLVKKP